MFSRKVKKSKNLVLHTANPVLNIIDGNFNGAFYILRKKTVLIPFLPILNTNATKVNIKIFQQNFICRQHLIEILYLN